MAIALATRLLTAREWSSADPRLRFRSLNLGFLFLYITYFICDVKTFYVEGIANFVNMNIIDVFFTGVQKFNDGSF